MKEERRKAARQRTFLKGRVLFNHGRGSAECVVRDISDNGARLQFSGSPVLPDMVELALPSRGETFRARLAWRAGSEIGVSFPDRDPGQAKQTPAPETDLASRVSALEQEVAGLKKQLRRLMGATESVGWDS